jgi:hypothetical protein
VHSFGPDIRGAHLLLPSFVSQKSHQLTPSVLQQQRYILKTFFN